MLTKVGDMRLHILYYKTETFFCDVLEELKARVVFMTEGLNILLS